MKGFLRLSELYDQVSFFSFLLASGFVLLPVWLLDKLWEIGEKNLRVSVFFFFGILYVANEG